MANQVQNHRHSGPEIKRHAPEQLFLEKQRIGNLSQIREFIFGAQDGLLVPLGVVSSVAGAFLNNHIVIVAGIAEGLAGAFSMASGAYLASQAEAQVHKSEIEKEAAAIQHWQEDERQELIMLFEHEHLPRKNAEIVVDNLMNSKKSFFNTMVQKEFGIDPNPPGTPKRDAMYIGLSYLISSVIPLSPYFFLPVRTALTVSILLTLAALFSMGLLKAKFARLDYIKSGLQVLAIGTLSGLGGYFLGTVLPKILHIR